MATAARPSISSSEPRPVHVCPFCGNTDGPIGAACPRCTLEDTPATRQATKQRIGPWFVLQKRNPAAPGMNLTTLRSLIAKGFVKPASVIRGPTTAQLWRLAANTKGVSREFGLCYGCKADIDRDTEFCPECQRSQVPPADDAVLDSRKPTSSPHPAEHDQEPPTEPVHTDRAEIAFTDGDLLTAKDLAKAFHLDYDPSGVAAVNTANKRSRISASLVAAPILILVAGVGAYTLFHSRAPVPKAKPNPQHMTITESIAGAAELASSHATSQPTDLESITAKNRPDAPLAKEYAPANATNSTPAYDSRTLWFAALDAESKNDFASAIKSYEKIESLPKTDWPAGLQTRLKLVRQELAAGTK